MPVLLVCGETSVNQIATIVLEYGAYRIVLGASFRHSSNPYQVLIPLEKG